MGIRDKPIAPGSPLFCRERTGFGVKSSQYVAFGVGVPVATNGGGYAESMAEHALAMALAAAKRLILEHENLKLGQFNQFTHNRMLAGGVCGIFGFGGIGAATGWLMHGIGHRSGSMSSWRRPTCW
jgi:phosphoglycerate dehydrogenase-like enzyme